ncbi:MAG: hypothetical protein IPM74_04630 [Crocinitomicaceae bacterium]|nr:hypothetical protein [Crocinitomicaceae bacterium]MBK8925190.1 hypothetical protein [Crocinitomicaceae bacterium]
MKYLFILSLFGLFGCKSKSKEIAFWNWFSSIEKEFYSDYINGVNIDQHNQEILTELHQVNPQIFFEISYGDNNTLNLTFTADGMIEIFPAVSKLVEVAPNYDSWNVFAFRQRIPGDGFVIEYGKYIISYSDIYFQYSTQNNQFGVQLNILNYDSTGEMQEATFVLLDNLLGEEDVVKEIDWIEWTPLNLEMRDSLMPFIELRNLVDMQK